MSYYVILFVMWLGAMYGIPNAVKKAEEFYEANPEGAQQLGEMSIGVARSKLLSPDSTVQRIWKWLS